MLEKPLVRGSAPAPPLLSDVSYLQPEPFEEHALLIQFIFHQEMDDICLMDRNYARKRFEQELRYRISELICLQSESPLLYEDEVAEMSILLEQLRRLHCGNSSFRLARTHSTRDERRKSTNCMVDGIPAKEAAGKIEESSRFSWITLFAQNIALSSE